eukprot:CAMPEP_0172462976 /NCGR_PEP_ID=MMETSP1065-20121228/45631_1 /TAXON_ID=265537 /ORGANISM="Amphiprora paludosa, Strain CCMP125" /LENGTH=194 /DNA_ID=CAMNT_0013218797 /DNA_START=104 /DNA_END=686 /DNA_ORIENTATION=-
MTPIKNTILLALCWAQGTASWTLLPPGLKTSQHERNTQWRRFSASERGSSELTEEVTAQQEADDLLNSPVAAQFQIVTCSATSCAKKRQALGQDEYSTFSAFYARAAETGVTVEETSCLGACRQAPCVAIQHEDYEGTVSLEGMTPVEFGDRVFQNIVDENDAERVWSSVVNAVQVMAELEEEEDDDEDEQSDR